MYCLKPTLSEAPEGKLFPYRNNCCSVMTVTEAIICIAWTHLCSRLLKVSYFPAGTIVVLWWLWQRLSYVLPEPTSVSLKVSYFPTGTVVVLQGLYIYCLNPPLSEAPEGKLFPYSNNCFSVTTVTEATICTAWTHLCSILLKVSYFPTGTTVILWWLWQRLSYVLSEPTVVRDSWS